MKILITGAQGQVGWELQRSLAPFGEIAAYTHAQLDLSNADAIRQAVRHLGPDLIVNAAAYTAVDQAEKEADRAHEVNAMAPAILAEEAKHLEAAFIHYSTDYVFDGQKQAPYEEIDAARPLNVYGESKLEGEKAVAAIDCAHLVLRTSWVYGARGKNFLRTILRLAEERDELRVVDDQHGAPTWSRMLAEATAACVSQCLYRGGVAAMLRERSGLYHLSAAGQTTWFGFADAIVQHAPKVPQMTPIPTSAYPLPAPRPMYSILSNHKFTRAFGLQLPDWRASLNLCLTAV